MLTFGTLYPAYTSYKAVKTKNVKEYVRWMMYWIVFAIFTTIETFTDIFISWFPFYYEIKVAFVVWLLSPYTKGASMIYRKFIHPTLSSKEKEIDCYISQAKDRGYETMVNFGRKGLNMAATVAVSAAAKTPEERPPSTIECPVREFRRHLSQTHGVEVESHVGQSQGAITGRLRSFSMHDLTSISGDEPVHYRDPLYPEEELRGRKPISAARVEYSRRLPVTTPNDRFAGESDSQDECKSDGEVECQRGSLRHQEVQNFKRIRRVQSHQVAKKKLQGKEVVMKSVKVRAKKKVVQSNSDTL
ncbi:receptor expression-enhancing protein 1-like isoform X4 [Scyliorhinus canicula]|uniref:receptor expression-enhancing protein 1-like isoform X4 n=1 Tax=Scyliorhinus canicula TaxID=7830 RepID=UPI0018F546F8|nr:receptor expression-enhancing protein 1-like isoform X4 [Scyliorhinus canicula]